METFTPGPQLNGSTQSDVQVTKEESWVICLTKSQLAVSIIGE